MGKFLELAFGVNHRNNLYKYGKGILNYLQPEQELYRSMFIYDEDIFPYLKETGSVKGYKGLLDIDEIVVDIDTDADNNLQKILTVLKDNQISDSAYQVWFSGRKGYHIHILKDAWGFTKNPLLPEQVSASVMNLFPFADPIYNRNRLIRFRNSYHEITGKYKVFIPHKYLSDIKMADIDASSPQIYQHEYVYTLPKPVFDIKTPEQRIQEYKAPNYGKATHYPRSYVCIHNIHENFFKRANNGEHTMHKEILALINHYKTIHGYSQNVVRNVLKPYIDYYISIKGETEFEKMMDYSYNKTDYNFGCSHEVLKPYCSSSCNLFSAKGIESIESSEERWIRIKTNESGQVNLISVFPMNVNYTIMPSEMIVILGAPGTGKTTFAFYMLNTLQLPTLYISSDSASHMLYQRAIQNKIHYTEEELIDATKNGERFSKYIDYLTFKDSKIDARSIESLINQMPIKPQIVAVDPMTSFDGVGKNEREILDNALDDIRNLANQKGLIFLLVSHLNRNDGRTNEINMFSGYMSSRIEKNADKIIGLKRNMMTMDKEGSNIIQVGHIKNRFGENLNFHKFKVDFERQKIEVIHESF